MTATMASTEPQARSSFTLSLPFILTHFLNLLLYFLISFIIPSCVCVSVTTKPVKGPNYVSNLKTVRMKAGDEKNDDDEEGEKKNVWKN